MTLTYAQGLRALADADLATELAVQTSGIGVMPWRPTPDPEATANAADCEAETAFRVTYAEGYDIATTTSLPATFENQPPQGGTELEPL